MSAFIRIDTCDDCPDVEREHNQNLTDVLCAYNCHTKEGHDYPWFNQDGTYDYSKVTRMHIHTVPLGEFLTIDVPEWCPRRK